MVGVQQEWLESEDSGFEETGDTITIVAKNDPAPYNPAEIFVENKHFSLSDILTYIKDGDIEVSPHFQRHFIWDRTRQSKLIESIFLGLPLPSLYLSQYDDGRLTIVDGLQRITTVQRFLDNQLTLTNMEYMTQCNGHKFSDLERENLISPLQMRRFRQTQLQCYVIDYRSPQRLRYDLFRRLNTGGKPLNNQEIRNCLSRPFVQDVLARMTAEKFKTATDGSVRSLRLEDQEVALRFIYFYDQYTEQNPVGKYMGNMDATLNDFVGELNNRKPEQLEQYVRLFNQAMIDAHSLFHQFAFRKVFSPGDPRESSRRFQINKLLLVVISVLLAKCREEYKLKIESGIWLTDAMADLISSDVYLFNAITWSTNSKANMLIVYGIIKHFFDLKLK
ncbi:MAG: DUF262 domain-containing protein [Paludibacteraceae bacterium]|nr:DUF262 domain-containing protein [Paludibacteraceae bacterium]